MWTIEPSVAAFSELTIELIDAGDDPALLQDESWRGRVAAEIETWSFAREAASGVIPPARFVLFHDTWIETLERLNRIGDDVMHGIDNLDIELVNIAGAQIIEVLVLLEEAKALLPLDWVLAEMGISWGMSDETIPFRIPTTDAALG